MKKLGGTIPDSMPLSRILSILSKEFQHFRSAWNSTAASQKSLENLTTRLLTEEQRMQKNESVDNTVALFSKFKVKDEGRQEQQHAPKRAARCYTCRKWDHLRKYYPGCFRCGSKHDVVKNCPKGKSDDVRSPSGPTAFVGHKIARSVMAGEWMIDSGSSDHMSNDRSLFDEFEKLNEPILVKIGNGQEISAVGKGTIQVEMLVENEWLPGMYDVLYTPEMMCNLFSVERSAKRGIFCHHKQWA